MSAKRKRIGLFGLFGTGNSGNDGSLEAMLVFLRRAVPEEQLLCICGEPGVVKEAFGVDAIPFYYRFRGAADGRGATLLEKVVGRATLWMYAARHLRRVKVLIVPGTGVLDDFSVGPLGWPHDVLCWWTLARLMGVKVILASIGAGPIHHPVSRWMMKLAARAAHYRSYRDEVSKDFMDSIGLDTRNDRICPDIAFRLSAPSANRSLVREPDRPTIGIGVMTYQGWQNDGRRGASIYTTYLETITEYALWLLNLGHRVRLLMGETSDRRAVADLLHALRSRDPDLADGSISFTPARTLHDIMEQMANLDIVVATRFHNVVCALKLGKPTISIGYAEKNDALLGQVGLADFCQHIERCDLGRLKDQTSRLLSDTGTLGRRISEVRTQFEYQLREQEDAILALVGQDDE
ncbi:MAG: polysaccharide pyruvyl transferase family protein [Kiloniellales bacterium]|nr:polysaccharide pyruvyl transferase family protein [Kiloniellales bacterium]